MIYYFNTVLAFSINEVDKSYLEIVESIERFLREFRYDKTTEQFIEKINA